MIQLRKAHERGDGSFDWLESYHTFSFANYYDPKYIHFSHLRVINEDFIAANNGFGMHPHKDMEILTYVLNGRVAHKDSMGNQTEVHAGEFQIMSAGSGIYHSEINPSHDETLLTKYGLSQIRKISNRAMHKVNLKIRRGRH